MSCPSPAFATDPATAAYYEQRAGEYGEWYTDEGRFAERDRPGWEAEVGRLVRLVEELPPCRTLDVAWGHRFLTRHLRGLVVAIDLSRSMVAIARARLAQGLALVGDGLGLAVAGGAFDRVLTGHFYGVGGELIVVDSAMRAGTEPEQWQERVLNDGSHHRVYKRYLSVEQLASEIGGEVLLDGRWFVAARAAWS